MKKSRKGKSRKGKSRKGMKGGVRNRYEQLFPPSLTAENVVQEFDNILGKQNIIQGEIWWEYIKTELGQEIHNAGDDIECMKSFITNNVLSEDATATMSTILNSALCRKRGDDGRWEFEAPTMDGDNQTYDVVKVEANKLVNSYNDLHRITILMYNQISVRRINRISSDQ